MEENEHYNTLTQSQKKLLIEQEQWMSDIGVKYDEERTRVDAIYDIKRRFPTELKAKKALESGGDPAILYLYYHDTIKKSRLKSNKSKPKKRNEIKFYEDTFLHTINFAKELKKYKLKIKKDKLIKTKTK